MRIRMVKVQCLFLPFVTPSNELQSQNRHYDNQLYFISQSGGISEHIISVIIRFVIVKII